MKRIMVLFALVLSFSAVAAASEKQLGVEEFTSVEELAVSLSSYFPKAQGEVKSVQGDRVTLSLGSKEGLIPGMVLTLWRDGKEILHPVTKAVIGRAEDEVGTAEVSSVTESSSIAVVKKKLKDPVQGDRARITPRKINIAIVPLRDDHPEIVRALAERLNEFGRLNVLDTGKVDVFLKNAKNRDVALVRELGTAFGLDAVISLGIYPSESRLMVTARIFYTEDASQLDTLVAMLNLKSRKESLGEIKPFFTPTPEKEQITTATAELPFAAKYFAVGDLEGDGKQEYVFSDGARLHVYRNEPSGWREVWTEVPSVKEAGPTIEWQGQTTVTVPGTTVQHINLDIADINGNGTPEIFVTAMVNGRVVSSVFEFRDGTFRRIDELPGFLRVVAFPGKGRILAGQDYDAATLYSGKPRQYVWSGGKYVPGEDIPLPKSFGLYGWAFANVGENRPLLAAFDSEDHLLVYSGDTLLWKSAEQYAAVDDYVYKPVTGVQAALSKQAASTDKGLRVRIPGRVITADLNGDGREQIIVPKNITGTFIGGFTSAEFDALRWTGARLDTAWNIKEVPGPVSDFRLWPDQAHGRLYALVTVKGSFFSKDHQQVMSYAVK